MSPIRLLPAAVAALALSAAAVALLPAEADAVAPGTLKPLQGFTRDFGSKHVVGYFAPTDAACSMTLVVADRVDPDLAPGTGTQVRFALGAGTSATLNSGDGGELALSCAGDAASVTVTASPGGA